MFVYVPELKLLMEKTEELLRSDPSVEEAVFVMTEKRYGYDLAIHHLHNAEEREREEEAFIQSLVAEGDTRVEYLVCMIDGHVSMRGEPGVELPSFHLRQRLLEIEPRNEAAGMLLRAVFHENGQEEEHYVLRKIGWSMPPKK